MTEQQTYEELRATWLTPIMPILRITIDDGLADLALESAFHAGTGAGMAAAAERNKR